MFLPALENLHHLFSRMCVSLTRCQCKYGFFSLSAGSKSSSYVQASVKTASNNSNSLLSTLLVVTPWLLPPPPPPLLKKKIILWSHLMQKQTIDGRSASNPPSYWWVQSKEGQGTRLNRFPPASGGKCDAWSSVSSSTNGDEGVSLLWKRQRRRLFPFERGFPFSPDGTESKGPHFPFIDNLHWAFKLPTGWGT